MTHKNITIIPVLAAIVLIPQLLFWWLAPDLEARWVVYIAGTVLTAGIPAAFFMTWRKTDIRRTAALLIVSAVFIRKTSVPRRLSTNFSVWPEMVTCPFPGGFLASEMP